MSSAARPSQPGPAVALAVAVAVTAAAALGACGGGGDGTNDAAPPIDARHLADAARVACSADAGCDPDLVTPVCDLDRNVCVECVADGDCERTGAFGPGCDQRAGYCRCARDEDCAGNRNGPFCHRITHACTCLLDNDCGPQGDCQLEPYLGSDVRTCRERPE